MQIAINVKGLDKIMRSFSTASPEVKKEINQAVRYSAIAIQREGRIEAPVLTGALRTNIKYATAGGRGTVGSYVKYSVYVHEGTKYQKSNPFMTRALYTATPLIDRAFSSAVQNIGKHLVK